MGILTKIHSKLLRTSNYEILLRKSSHKYMKWPFGQCMEYDVPNDRTYKATSQIECQRRCLMKKYMEDGNCVPRFVNDMLTEFDSIDNRTNFCPQYYGNKNIEFALNCQSMCDNGCLMQQFMHEGKCMPGFISEFFKLNTDKFRNNYDRTKYCSKLFDNKNISLILRECQLKCPEECFQVEYWSTPKETQLGRDRSILDTPNILSGRNDSVERRIVWSSSEPMFAYIDEPVLTFTAYLVYCGGLMGLWFGQSLKDLLSLFIVKLSNRFQLPYY